MSISSRAVPRDQYGWPVRGAYDASTRQRIAPKRHFVLDAGQAEDDHLEINQAVAAEAAKAKAKGRP